MFHLISWHTSDIQHCCGRAPACRGVHSAAILAMVPRSGIGDGQHRPPRTNFNIIYIKNKTKQNNKQKKNKQQFRCWCQGVHGVQLVHPWPSSGWLLGLLHSTDSTASRPAWHLKLTDSPWRTVAVCGSTEMTIWLATEHTHLQGQISDNCVSLCVPIFHHIYPIFETNPLI